MQNEAEWVEFGEGQHGLWIDVPRIKCSACNVEAVNYTVTDRDMGASVDLKMYVRTKHCPNCGQKMRNA